MTHPTLTATEYAQIDLAAMAKGNRLTFRALPISPLHPETFAKEWGEGIPPKSPYASDCGVFALCHQSPDENTLVICWLRDGVVMQNQIGTIVVSDHLEMSADGGNTWHPSNMRPTPEPAP